MAQKLKRITLNKIIRNKATITEKEELWIDEMLHKLETPNEDRQLINQIYQMAKTYSNSEFTTEDLFMKALEVYIIQAPTKVTFKNPEKWKKQLLLRVRMKILEIITI